MPEVKWKFHRIGLSYSVCFTPRIHLHEVDFETNDESRTFSGILINLSWAWQWVIQKIVLGGGSTNKCDHDCDQAVIKSSWGSV